MSNETSPHDIVLQAAKKDEAALSIPSQHPDPDLSLSLDKHKSDLLKQELKEAQDTHKLRLGYTGKIFWLVVAWLVCVLAAVLMSGFSVGGFSLSDKVIITFITSTTINVVGLFLVVAKWMFPSSRRDKDS